MYRWEPDYDGADSCRDGGSLSAYESPRGSFRRHSYTGTAITAFVNSAAGGLERRWSDELLSAHRSTTEEGTSSPEEEEDDLEEEPKPLRIPRVRASYNAAAAAAAAASTTTIAATTYPLFPEAVAEPSTAATEAREDCAPPPPVQKIKELHPFVIVGDNRVRLTVRRTKPLLGLVIEGGCNTTQITPRIVGIHPEGAAQETGVLRPGQELLEVQGVPTQRLTHAHVARLLADAYYGGGGGDGVTIIVAPVEPRRRFSFIWDADTEV